MNYISDKARCMFWFDRLKREILPQNHFTPTGADAGHDPDAAHEAADKCLEDFQKASNPDWNHHSKLLATHWLKLAGDRIARELNYPCHDGSDALRFWLASTGKVPLADARDLKEDTLIWIFCGIDLA